MMEKNILLFSGGLDSLIAWYYLDKPVCLYVDIGHRYNKTEKESIQRVAKLTEMTIIIDRRIYLGDQERGDAFIPMRNSFLLHTAALYADNIWIAIQKGEMEIPDRSDKFLEAIGSLLSFLQEREIKVDTPFREMTKTEMVRWYLERGHPVEALYTTTSCYNGNSCGECAACFRRWVSMELNGLTECYRIDPWTTPLAKEYLKRAKKGRYDEERNNEILMALKRKHII